MGIICKSQLFVIMDEFTGEMITLIIANIIVVGHKPPSANKNPKIPILTPPPYFFFNSFKVSGLLNNIF